MDEVYKNKNKQIAAREIVDGLLVMLVRFRKKSRGDNR